MKLSLDVVKATVKEIASALKAKAEAKLAEPVKVTLPEKAQKIKDILDKHGHHMGCQEPTVRNMMEVLLDLAPETLRKIEKARWLEVFTMGVIVVPLTAENGHNYTINKPVMMYGNTRALRPSGTIGNYLLADEMTNEQVMARIRLATDAEIDEFIGAIEQGILTKLPSVLENIPDLETEGGDEE